MFISLTLVDSQLHMWYSGHPLHRNFLALFFTRMWTTNFNKTEFIQNCKVSKTNFTTFLCCIFLKIFKQIWSKSFASPRKEQVVTRTYTIFTFINNTLSCKFANQKHEWAWLDKTWVCGIRRRRLIRKKN